MLDSHCHLDFAEFDADRAELLAEARTQGVQGWLVPGVHEGLWAAQEALLGVAGVRLAVGVHPWWLPASGLLDDVLDRLKERAHRLGAVAWGECGLDAKRGQVEMAAQLRWFEAQLELARSCDLPVIVHQAGAREEFLQALGRCGALPRGGVVHGFSGDAAWAQALVQRGLHLGFGAAVLDERRARLQEAWRAVPLSAVLLETDAPAGARGQRSTPADLVRIVRSLAELRGLAAEDLARAGDDNLARLLGLDGPQAFAEGAAERRAVCYSRRVELPVTLDSKTVRRSAESAPSPAAAPTASEKVEPAEEARYRTHRRFDRAARLFGEPALHRLMGARVLVVGVGGVGSFTAEALARSGVGTLVLIDFDRVCITNTNRQLHAMQGTIGQRKVDVMAERLRLIHPTGSVEAVPEFYNRDIGARLLAGKVDYVVDAIDNLTAKAHLIASCLERKIPVVSSMGAAARLDPTAISVADLAETHTDPFAAAVRKILRSEYGLSFDKGRPLGVKAVFSTEEPQTPQPPSYDEGVGFRCVCPGGKNGLHDCDRRARIDGSAAFVTGAFGLTAASVVVRAISATAAP